MLHSTYIRPITHPHGNQSTDLQCKSIDWFLFECNTDLIRIITGNYRNEQKQPFTSILVVSRFSKFTEKYLYRSLPF